MPVERPIEATPQPPPSLQPRTPLSENASEPDLDGSIVLGAQMDCVRPHFYEVMVNYRFLSSYRNQLCE